MRGLTAERFLAKRDTYDDGTASHQPLALDDMKRFYEPDLTSNPDSPFIRDGDDKLVRRSGWIWMIGRLLW